MPCDDKILMKNGDSLCQVRESTEFYKMENIDNSGMKNFSKWWVWDNIKEQLMFWCKEKQMRVELEGNVTSREPTHPF